MKSENQIIVRCKQPMKIEKPLQGLFMFSYTMLVKEIFFRQFFLVFVFSMASIVMIIVIELCY